MWARTWRRQRRGSLQALARARLAQPAVARSWRTDSGMSRAAARLEHSRLERSCSEAACAQLAARSGSCGDFFFEGAAFEARSAQPRSRPAGLCGGQLVHGLLQPRPAAARRASRPVASAGSAVGGGRVLPHQPQRLQPCVHSPAHQRCLCPGRPCLAARAAKAERVAPRPVAGLLRPVVSGQVGAHRPRKGAVGRALPCRPERLTMQICAVHHVAHRSARCYGVH